MTFEDSTSFVNSIIKISEIVKEQKNQKKLLNNERVKKFEKIKLEKKENIFKLLTEKYHSIIKNEITFAAHNGKREKYINFDKNDFKVNFPTLGYPKDIQKEWLDEVITNPASDLLPRTYDNDMPEHFYGLNYEIWNNRNFTTRFTW